MSETTTSDIQGIINITTAAKYNPHLWGAEELKAIFVARQKELALLTTAIREAQPGYAPQHLLLIGQRGMGKTTLLQRIALQVEEDDTLNQDWLPLRFPEEQYTVSTLAELWGNVLGALADALETKNASTAQIDQYLVTMETLSEEQQESETLAFINQWCEDNHKRLLLLIDSTDLLFGNLSAGAKRQRNKKSKRDNASQNLWRLRKALQHNHNLLWLGGSYQALEASDLYHDAFIDFFRLIKLKPLTLDEMAEAMKAMAYAFGAGRGLKQDDAVAEITEKLTARPERLKTLHALTGGVPRTAVMLFELFAAGGNDQVKEDLARLLDMMTPLYKARLEALPEQQRKLLAHVMEYWQPISSGQLAQVSGLSNAQISPQLVRMEQQGLIEKTPLPRTSRAGYQVSERFFNIWYLMRNASRRLKLRLVWLVEFMRLWYQPQELEQLAHQRLEYSHSLTDLEFNRAVAMAMPCDSHARHALDYETYQRVKVQKQQLDEYFDFCAEDKPFQNAQQYETRMETLHQQLLALPFYKSEQEKEHFCLQLLASLQFSIDNKEQITKDIKTADAYQALCGTLDNEFNPYDVAQAETFQRLVSDHQLYPDLPEQPIALVQLEKLLNETPQFFWPLAWRYWEKFQDKKIDNLIITALQKPPGHLVLCNASDLSKSIKARLDNQEIKKLIPHWSHSYLENCNAVEAFNIGFALELADFFENAAIAYRKAIELDKNYALPWYNLGCLYQVHLNQYKDAEQAYLQAFALDQEDEFTPWSLGKLYACQDKIEQANHWFSKAKNLVSSHSDHNLLLQINLWFSNFGLADEALSALTKRAYLNDYSLYQQCWECQQIGLGLALAELMSKSQYKEFLEPLELALRKINGDDDSIKGAAFEVQQLAQEIAQIIEERIAH